ncbi:MAG: DUF4159 domain-containing protein [Archangium sp.]|nr:DUF4159 domain-containing protein [Archangium sp.]
MTLPLLTRRHLLAAALGTPLSARAFGNDSRFVAAVVKHAGRWDSRVSGLRRLAWELQRRTSTEVVLDARPLELDSPALFEHPFLYLSSEGPLAPLSTAEVEHLRRYLTYGGFLFVDAVDLSDGAGFDASFRRELARVLPHAPLTPVPMAHVVYKSFFILDAAPGRALNRSTLEAVMVGKRAAVMYSQNDLFGALNRDESGAHEFDVSPGGERQRELATRLAINVAMYALCLDYKDDAVHLPAIMQRRR